MKKLIASVLTFALLFGVQPIVTPVLAQNTASIAGTATDPAKGALQGVRVQLRNVDTGQLSGTTTSGANGAFSFTGLPPGNYVVEIVDATGKVIGVSTSIALAAGAAITGLTLSASAASAAAAAAGAAAGGSFFATTTGILVTAAAVVGGAAAVVAATNDASPSGG